jgi:RNA polymerase sigma-70 factor, ECF subfamily
MDMNCRPTQASDEQVVEAVLKGDASAFGTLVDRHWKTIVAIALSRIADRALAEDVAQDSFLKAYSHLHSLRRPSQFGGWLSKIAIQECANTLRNRIRHREALASAPVPDQEAQAVGVFASNPGLSESQALFVRQAVSRLPEKSRNVVVMRFVAGLSAVQIAEQLGKRPGTVRVWLHRAYRILRKDLAPLLEEVRS